MLKIGQNWCKIANYHLPKAQQRFAALFPRTQGRTTVINSEKKLR